MWVGVAIFLGLRELRAGNSPEPKVRLQDSEILKVENRLKCAQLLSQRKHPEKKYLGVQLRNHFLKCKSTEIQKFYQLNLPSSMANNSVCIGALF